MYRLRMIICVLALQPTVGMEDCAGQDFNGSPRALPNGAAKSKLIANSTSVSIELKSAVLKTIESTAVPAQVEGSLIAFAAKEGMLVEEGQTLGAINDDAIKIKLQQLKTQVEIARKKQTNDINVRLAQKTLEVADNEYQRALNTNARVPETYPVNEIDRLRLIADQAKLELERAKHEQQLAKYEVQVKVSDYRQTYELFRRHQLKSPVTGIVVGIEKTKGEWVQPGSEILRIVRVDRLRVEGFLPSSDASKDLIGNKATVSLKGQTKVVEGKVVFVSPDANTINSQVRVFVEVENSDGYLRPGLPVTTEIHPNL